MNTVRNTTEDEEGCLRRGRFERGTILVNPRLKVTWGEELWQRRVEERDIIRTAAAVTGNCRAPTRSNGGSKHRRPRTAYVYLRSSSILSDLLGPSLHLAERKKSCILCHLSRAELSYLDRLNHPWHAYHTPFRLLPLAVHLSLVNYSRRRKSLSGAPFTASLFGPRTTQTPEPRR